MPTFRPLTAWPGERTRKRRKSPFQVTYTKILAALDTELFRLRAQNVVIQAECAEGDIRIDGHLRSSASLRGPGVVITFDSKHGPLSYACDTYTDWTANIRAITLTLEALRRIERYGATRGAQQYRGWKALPEGQPIAAAEWATVEDAAKFLIGVAIAPRVPSFIDVDCAVKNAGVVRAWWKDAAKRAHPDAGGGSGDTMAKVNRAVEFIARYQVLNP